MAHIVEATPRTIADAATTLRRGGVVAFATETVYGLGADTFNLDAIEAVYRIKGRPADNPLIAHVLDVAGAMRVADGWNQRCSQLAKMFWPGPLTLVLAKADRVPAQATAGRPTIAVRSPAHPVAIELLRACGGPISAPSANRSGHVSPTTAAHVADDFADVDALVILDGGPCRVGLESTVLDMTSTIPRLLRPGAITIEQLQAQLGSVDDPILNSQAHGPGTAQSHYSPRTRTILVSAAELQLTLSQLREPAAVLCQDQCVIDVPHQKMAMLHEALSSQAAAYAASLYDALRRADALGVSTIVIVKPAETTGLWRAIHDRLRRAAAQSSTGSSGSSGLSGASGSSVPSGF